MLCWETLAVESWTLAAVLQRAFNQACARCTSESEPLTSVEFHSSVVELSCRGHDAVGIDISQAAIEAARGPLGRGAPFIVGDVTGLPFRHASFDVVLDKATFDVRAQHLNSPPIIAHDSPNLELQFSH